MSLPKPELSETTNHKSMNSEPKTVIAPPIVVTAEINTDTIYLTKINKEMVDAIGLVVAPTSNYSHPKHPPIHGSENLL